jgi:hypothetical protein
VTRTAGCIFESTFRLPKAANRGNTQPRKSHKTTNSKRAPTEAKNVPKVPKHKRIFQAADLRGNEMSKLPEIEILGTHNGVGGVGLLADREVTERKICPNSGSVLGASPCVDRNT